ncbi:hypothetical protein EPO14_00910 [Patescibacteria group bacterium]|nr:MAG: hypothetical protein EPO14_00910 [Patescibacteria group bacterium]
MNKEKQIKTSPVNLILLIAACSLIFYLFVYRPEHIKEVCRLAYPDSVPVPNGFHRLPSLEPDYENCLKSYDL